MVLASTLTVEVDSILSAADSAQQHDLETALSGLESLHAFEVSTQLLSETQIGKKIRKLTKHEDSNIAEAAKSLVAKWKECVRQEQEEQGKRTSGCESTHWCWSELCACYAYSLLDAAALDADAKSSGSNKRPRLERQTAAQEQPTEIKHESLDQLKASLPKLDDAMRHKTAVLMLDGLHKALQEGAEGDAAKIAAEVEQAIFLQNGGVNANYKTKVRSLAFNMKDARNPDLRARVLEGDITGHVLVTLSSDELASNERRKENKEIRQHALREANPAGIKKATTDAFQWVLLNKCSSFVSCCSFANHACSSWLFCRCGKCKQKKCVYYVSSPSLSLHGCCNDVQNSCPTCSYSCCQNSLLI